jgi:hypothetical protein
VRVFLPWEQFVAENTLIVLSCICNGDIWTLFGDECEAEGKRARACSREPARLQSLCALLRLGALAKPTCMHPTPCMLAARCSAGLALSQGSALARASAHTRMHRHAHMRAHTARVPASSGVACSCLMAIWFIAEDNQTQFHIWNGTFGPSFGDRAHDPQSGGVFRAAPDTHLCNITLQGNLQSPVSSGLIQNTSTGPQDCCAQCNNTKGGACPCLASKNKGLLPLKQEGRAWW